MISFSNTLVLFYRWWHGTLHLKGAGLVLSFASRLLPGLRNYSLLVQGIGLVPINLSDVSGFAWLNLSLNETGQEEGVLKCIKSIIPCPGCVWEVGANGGYFAVQLIHIYPKTKRMYLFEPNPAMEGMLEAVSRSRSGIVYCPFALADSNSRAAISFHPGNSSMATLLGTPAQATVEITLKTGDDFLSSNPDAIPDLIIIDVEGAERQVLQGMKELLKSYKPVVVFEQIFFDPSVLDSLMPEGYSRFTVDDNTGSLISGYSLSAGHNGIFVPPRSLASSPSRTL
jgi:FkbM family methyltransferase